MVDLKLKTISADAVDRILDIIQGVEIDVTGWCVRYNPPKSDGPKKAEVNEAVYDQLVRTYNAISEAQEIIRENGVFGVP